MYIYQILSLIGAKGILLADVWETVLVIIKLVV